MRPPPLDVAVAEGLEAIEQAERYLSFLHFRYKALGDDHAFGKAPELRRTFAEELEHVLQEVLRKDAQVSASAIVAAVRASGLHRNEAALQLGISKQRLRRIMQGV